MCLVGFVVGQYSYRGFRSFKGITGINKKKKLAHGRRFALARVYSTKITFALSFLRVHPDKSRA